MKNNRNLGGDLVKLISTQIADWTSQLPSIMNKEPSCAEIAIVASFFNG